jgi:Tfp pilus assembly protein FimT
MIALAVIAILAAVAIPNYLGWLPKRHLQSSAVDVQAAINLAKLTAIRENTDVVLTFNPAGNDYLAFIDTDEDGSQDAGERTIRHKEMSPGIDLDSTNFASDKLTFDSMGLADASGDITLKNRRDENKIVNVTITGMSRIN